MPTNQKRDRAADKRRKYLREHGRPSLVTDEEFERVKAHVHDLHSRGMSYPWIADLAGVHDSTVGCLASLWRGKERGRATGMRRSKYDAIMAVEFTEPPSGRFGSRWPNTGAIRRLRGLCAKGFALSQLSQELDVDRAVLGKIIRQERSTSYIHYALHVKVKAAYEKLRDVDPMDMGGTRYSVGRALGAARRHGYVHPDHWDDDTIDDPNAVPEYTGRCGSMVGALIHLRESIPICPPCEQSIDNKRKIDPYVVHEMNNEGKSAREIAAHFGVSKDSIHQYTSILNRGKRHELADVNTLEMRAVCELCGPTTIVQCGIRPDGRMRVQCATAKGKTHDDG